MVPFEVTPDDISALSDLQLTHLLHRLLLLEAERMGLPKSRVSVSLRITIADAGQDGKIEWTDGPDAAGSNWIPNRNTLFQVKATGFEPADCGPEILAKRKGDDPPALKAKVDQVVQQGGAYVLFYYKPCEGTMVDARVSAFRRAIAECRGSEVAETAQIEVYGAEKISSWANEHIAAVAFVKRSIGRAIPADLQTWNGWDGYHQTHLSFHPDESRTRVLEELRQRMGTPGTVARVVGLSGLGKSRLALELFRPPLDAQSDPQQAALSASCVYVADGADSDDAVKSAMMAFRQRGVRATIVVDECPLELHEKLERIATAAGSVVSLLTLDFDPTSDPKSPRCAFYRLEPYSTVDITHILKQSHAAIPAEHLSRVAEIAQGFPRMAELLADAILQGQRDLWSLAPSTLVAKLVARRSKDPERLLMVARALSVVEHLGIDGLAADELAPFSQRLCGLSSELTYQTIRELERAGIAYRRGDYVRITPLPIAVTLASEWWQDCSPDRAERLLIGGELPPLLVDATANQLKRLAGHPWVHGLVSRIYGPDSPFRQRDPLNSALGSRLANSLAEVNPEAVARALYAAFGSMTPEEASAVATGRRELVWCLQKLAWWPSTFHDAAWMFLVFAAGENETWGNNATGEFPKLFHVYLGGTEVPALERVRVLKRALSTGQPEYVPIVVQALCEALESGSFSRTGGPDVQGGGFQRDDWKPSTYGEIWAYWRATLDLLLPYLLADSEVGSSARSGVGGRARGMIRWGGLPIIEDLVEEVLLHRSEWPELLDGLRSALNYDGEEYPPEIKARAETLVARLAPTTLESRLRHTVSLPAWHELRKEPDGSTTVVAEERARALAVECAENLGTLRPHLSSLSRGEQRQAFAFGTALAGAAADPMSLFGEAIESLREVPFKDRNPSLAMGMASQLASAQQYSVRAHIRRLLDDDDLRGVAVDLIRAIRSEPEDLAKIASLLHEGKVGSREIHGFVFGRALDALPSEQVARMVLACARVDENGPVVALELLGMRLHANKLDAVLADATMTLLADESCLKRVLQRGESTVGHHLEELARACLQGAPPPGLVSQLTRALVDSLDAPAGFPMGHYVRKVFEALLGLQPDLAWPILRARLTTPDASLALRMELTLEKFDLVSLIGEHRLLEWCAVDDAAPRMVARMIHPLRSPVEGSQYPSWSDFATTLLQQFGRDPGVRSSLSASIYTGAWAGSAVPRLQQHREAFMELREHPISEVAEWASSTVDSLDAQIERERKRDEERDFGILR